MRQTYTDNDCNFKRGVGGGERIFFFKSGKKIVRHEILRELDFCLIIKTIKSHSNHGLRI